MDKKRREELEQQLARLKEVDEAIHRSYPPGGNAHHEAAMNKVGDLIREINKELGQ